MGLIYMRISPSGGKYIGQTTIAEHERWQGHIKEAYATGDRFSDSILNRAIRKYGSENFTVTILEDNIPSVQLNEREIYWINKLHTYYEDNQHGYNMTLGGTLGARTKSTTIPVLQYDLSGNFIKQWNCATDVVTYYNDIISNLLLVLEHKRLYSYKKYLWKYIDDTISIETLIFNYKQGQANRSYKSIKVYCQETDTYYPSFSQAEKELNISRKLISKYAKLEQIEPKSQLHFKIIKGDQK